MEARQAVYPVEMIAPVPPAKQSRYVMHGRSESSPLPKVRIVPELRRMVRFAALNLMDRVYPFDIDFDVILLRNVLIYFEKTISRRSSPGSLTTFAPAASCCSATPNPWSGPSLACARSPPQPSRCPRVETQSAG